MRVRVYFAWSGQFFRFSRVALRCKSCKELGCAEGACKQRVGCTACPKGAARGWWRGACAGSAAVPPPRPAATGAAARVCFPGHAANVLLSPVCAHALQARQSPSAKSLRAGATHPPRWTAPPPPWPSTPSAPPALPPTAAWAARARPAKCAAPAPRGLREVRGGERTRLARRRPPRAALPPCQPASQPARGRLALWLTGQRTPPDPPPSPAAAVGKVHLPRLGTVAGCATCKELGCAPGKCTKTKGCTACVADKGPLYVDEMGGFGSCS